MVTNPLAGQDINIQPELSINTEIGWRGTLLKDHLSGQIAYFNNTIRNFYAGGRNEVFQELGKINMQGVEVGVGVELFRSEKHQLQFHGNATFLKSKILSGKLLDKDLFSQVTHSSATREEFIDKVNSNRKAYEIYTLNGQGEEVLVTSENLTEGDFANISKSIVTFGDGGAEETKVPYA
ncbi:MAG: TonB-dependent receptor, partial [Bacteroidetes bacterium]|nr:TonB-dependent receptor [Bacteroidota bacterium]